MTAMPVAAMPSPTPIRDLLLRLPLFLYILLLGISSSSSSKFQHTNVNTDEHHFMLQKEAMQEAVAAASTSTSGTEEWSIQEQRFFHYFHSGLERAATNAMFMGGYYHETASNSQLDYNGKRISKNHIDELEHLQFLEEALEEELKRVRYKLLLNNEHQQSHNEKDQVKESGEEGVCIDENSVGSQQSDHHDNDNNHNANTADEGTSNNYSELDFLSQVRQQLIQEYQRFQCAELWSNISSDAIDIEELDPYFLLLLSGSNHSIQDKLKEIHSHFWKFAMKDYNYKSNDINSNASDSEKSIPYSPNLQVYIDSKLPISDTDTRDSVNKLFLFAARPFQAGEVVYSPIPNMAFFHEVSTFTRFLYSLPLAEEACWVMECSFVKKVSRPGRWYIGLVLDEGVFLTNEKEVREKWKGDSDENNEATEGNVALAHDRSFDYIAVRDISKGERIVETEVSAMLLFDLWKEVEEKFE